MFFLNTICSISFALISGILFKNDTKTAIIVSLGIIFCNAFYTFIPYNDMHYSLQFLSNFSFIRYSLECLLIMIYGFNRCSDNEFSSVLYFIDKNDSDFWTNIFHLILLTIFYTITAIILFIYKFNSNNVYKYKTNNMSNNMIEQKNQFVI